MKQTDKLLAYALGFLGAGVICLLADAWLPLTAAMGFVGGIFLGQWLQEEFWND